MYCLSLCLTARCPPLAGLERRLPRTPELHHPDPQHSVPAHVERRRTWLPRRLFYIQDSATERTESTATGWCTDGLVWPEIKRLLEQRVYETSSWRRWRHLWAGSGWCYLWKPGPACLSAWRSVCLSVCQSAGTDCSWWADGHFATCIFCKIHFLSLSLSTSRGLDVAEVCLCAHGRSGSNRHCKNIFVNCFVIILL